ncbi:MAG TPA: cyclase family protein [Gemmatimonadaceae bacterium]|nr:cyclase family protein [Gemmatimonadaceae bacterium]
MSEPTAEIIDISVALHPGLAPFPRNPPFGVTPVLRIAAGDSSNVSELRIGTHAGTHVDPPSHFFDGAPAADALALDALVGPATVLDLTGVERAITPADLDAAGLAPHAVRVLLRTRNSARWREPDAPFATDYVSLAPEAARLLVERGVRLVGIDALSIEGFGAPGRPTHHALLSAGVIVVEGLDLSAAPAGDYFLACLPLKLIGADGAPARAVLLRR